MKTLHKVKVTKSMLIINLQINLNKFFQSLANNSRNFTRMNEKLVCKDDIPLMVHLKRILIEFNCHDCIFRNAPFENEFSRIRKLSKTSMTVY